MSAVSEFTALQKTVLEARKLREMNRLPRGCEVIAKLLPTTLRQALENREWMERLAGCRFSFLPA